MADNRDRREYQRRYYAEHHEQRERGPGGSCLSGCTCGPKKSCSACQRGLACRWCNAIVGFADDDPARLELIATNLRRLSADARGRINGKPVQEPLPIDIKRAARQQAADVRPRGGQIPQKGQANS